MSWASDTRFRFQIFAMGMTIVCPVFLILTTGETKRQLDSNSWPSVEGEVEQAFAKTEWDEESKDNLYFGRVLYRYVVNGKEYKSDLTDLGPGAKRSDLQSALADVSEFEPGMTVPVYYDPADPGIGIVVQGVPTFRVVLLLALMIGTLIGATVTFFSVRGWLRKRSTTSGEAP